MDDLKGLERGHKHVIMVANVAHYEHWNGYKVLVMHPERQTWVFSEGFIDRSLIFEDVQYLSVLYKA